MTEPARSPRRLGVAVWGTETIAPGEARDLFLNVSESYSGMTVRIPLHVIRGPVDGPTVFISAACHGDEINGTGAIRSLLQHGIPLRTGAVILVPVLNILGFDRHTRYLPDRRDLNRCFPGSRQGSLARRMARVIFEEIVSRADYGIDLHTAAIRRTNFPNVRGDMSVAGVPELARAFGCEFIVHGKGPQGSLRREACAAGCPTIIMEGGEVWKVESSIMACAIRGIRNVLRSFGMLDGPPEPPPFQIELSQTRWVRADRGGFIRFHVAPGDVVRQGAPLATNTSLLGKEINHLAAPFDAVVLGVTTLPAVSPGEPVYHLARLTNAALDQIESARQRAPSAPQDDVHKWARDDLATHLHVEQREGQPG